MLATARMLHGAREEDMTAGGTGWEVSSPGVLRTVVVF